MLHEFWVNFTHNLFKPLLLFFYFGFLIPIFKCDSSSLCALPGPNPVSAAGHRLARRRRTRQDQAVQRRRHRWVHGGWLRLELRDRHLGILPAEQADRHAPGRQGDGRRLCRSDSAGTFATCVAVLTSVGMAFDAYMPVMLAVMEIPGCLVALYLVARLRHRG